MKKIIVLVVIIGLVAGGIIFWKSKQAGAASQASADTTTTVKRSPIRRTVQCTGRIVANLEVEIKCKASGEIKKLPFDISEKVKKGDLIMELDPIDMERGVQQSEAALAASKAKLAQAKTNLAVAEKNLEAEKQRSNASLRAFEAHAVDSAAKAEREKKLFEKKLSSQEECETAQTSSVQAEEDLKTARAHMSDVKAQEVQLEVKRQDVKLAESQLVSDDIALKIAKQRLEDTKVISPIDGVVSSRTVQIGQIISSGISNVGGGTTALTLSDLSRLFLLASVDEAEIGDVAMGQTAEITADAFPGRKFRGQVVRIATKGVTVQNVTTFEVKIEVVDKKKTMLKPEMTGNVDVLIAEKGDALVVPVEAVSRRMMGKSFVILKKSDGTMEERHEVETGITDNTNIEIVSGLNENDVIMLQKNGADSRWSGGGDPNQKRRQQMMMMRMGGGGGGGGRH